MARAKSVLSLRDRNRPELHDLNDKHRHALRLMFLGANNKEVAQETGFTVTNVSLIRDSEVAQEHLTKMHEDLDQEAITVQKRVEHLIPQAIQVYQELIENPEADPKDRLKAADAVCDRGGLPRQSSTKVEASVNHLHVTGNQISALKAQAIQAAREMGVLVDTTATVVSPGSSSTLPVSAAAEASE